jgi:hypothetical protein
MFRQLLSVAAVIAFALLIAATSAVAEETEVLPLGFEVPATDGYRATVLAGVNPKTSAGGAILGLTRRRGGLTSTASYAVHGEITETTIKASFGSLGEIDVHAVPGAGTVTERSKCGGEPVTIDQGRWEGTIRFRGEGGYTSIDATGGSAIAAPFLNLLCTAEVDEGLFGHSPGAPLELGRRHGSEALELSVRKNRHVGPVRIAVGLMEREGPMSIERTITTVDTSKAFDFAIPPGRATVAPAAPFSGSLSFVRRPKGTPSLRGDLAVDLPGRDAVPILGPGKLRASLVRAVLNPSHPF